MHNRYIYSFIQKSIEFHYQNVKGMKVLMFHQVNDNIRQWVDAGISITEKSFYKLIDDSIEKGYRILSFDQVDTENLNNTIVLTFDDIFSDTVEKAVPYLIKKSIPFTVFVCPDLIGKKKYITHQQLVALLKCEFCTIGFHANKHKIMRTLNHDEIDQLLNCDLFSKATGKQIDFFAFPFGSLYAVNRYAKCVALKKYKIVCSTFNYECTKQMFENSGMMIPRINVNEENCMEIL